MNYQIDVEEAKKLIGDMTLEIYALRRDNIKLSEALQKYESAKPVHEMPEPRQELKRTLREIEKESNG